ncbi:MAG TPA: prepilin peptidase [Nitrospirota bacterium]|nr:prepilin peptidase [Nitrospirota bacterium]
MIVIIMALIFGLIVGSFLNVCIARLPRGRSIVTPRSHCPRCRYSIKFFDNIPIISFIILRGKCRNCGEPISWRYPFVELTNGVLYAWTVQEFWITGEAFLIMALCSSLIAITFIDFDHQIIPDAITLPGMLVGLALAPVFMSVLNDPLPFQLDQFLPHAGPHLKGFLNSLIGLLLGGGPLLAIGWIWEKLRHVEAMGGGDVKLMGMVGSFLGWKGALLTIMLGAFIGSVAGLILIIIKKHKMERVIPFGPFLALGTLMTAFYGPDIISWYLGLIHV